MTETHHFKQRIPAFVDPRGVTPTEFDFETVEELEQHPYIQRWLSKSPSSYLAKGDRYLSVVEDEGFTSWCIGWITNSDKLKLPTLESRTIVQYDNGTLEIKTENSENPVVMWCGGEAELKDGTVCKWIRYEDCKKDPTLWQKFQEIK